MSNLYKRYGIQTLNHKKYILVLERGHITEEKKRPNYHVRQDFLSQRKILPNEGQKTSRSAWQTETNKAAKQVHMIR